MTNLEYNIVLSFCRILLYLKFSVTNFDVVPDSDIDMYEDSGVAAVYCRHNFQQLLQQTNTTKVTYCVCLWQPYVRLHIVCVCDTVLIRLDSIFSFTFPSNTNSCVRRENISPFISFLPASNAIPNTYQINTCHIQPMLSFKRLKWRNVS